MREFEVVIMVEVLTGEMVGSDWRFTREITDRTLAWDLAIFSNGTELVHE